MSLLHKLKSLKQGLALKGKAKEAHEEFLRAVDAGEVSVRKELAPGVESPGAAWLALRAKLVPVIATFLGGALLLADQLLATNLAEQYNADIIETVATLIVSAGFLWGAADGVRSSARVGVLPKPKPSEPTG